MIVVGAAIMMIVIDAFMFVVTILALVGWSAGS